MFKPLQKYFYKRRYIKLLIQQIWENEIEIMHQATGVVDVEAECQKLKAKAVLMQDDWAKIETSHKREDREKAKEMAQEIENLRKLIGKHEQSVITLQKNIDSKKTSNTYLLGKIEFVKTNFSWLNSK